MNQTDARKLTDAIKDLTKQLRGNSGGPGGVPTPNVPNPTTPTGSDPISVQEAVIERVREELKVRQAAASWQEASDADRLTRLAELKDLDADSVELTREQRAELEALIPFQLGYTEAIEEAVKASEDLTKERKKEERQLRRLQREQRHLNELERERHDLLEDTHDVVNDVFDSILRTSKLKPDPKRGVAGFLRTVMFDAEAREEALDTFINQVKSFKSLLAPMNLAAAAAEGLGVAIGSAVTLGFGLLVRAVQAAIEFIVAMALRFDALGSEIAKATGHGREFAGEMISAADGAGKLSTSMEEMMPGLISLSNQLTGVSGISRSTALSFGVVATAAARMGVSVEETGKFMSDAMVGGKMSADEARQSFINLNAAASAMGKNFSDLMGDFSATRTTFAAFGQNMEKTFLRSSSVARQLNVNLNTLVGLSDKFKTFEAAAGFVAEFNHMVGASLDPLELMRIRAEEGPAGVAKAVKDSLDLSGKSFNELSFAMREGIADNLGVPMDELRNMMEADLDMSMADEVADSSQIMDRFLKKGDDALTFMEKLGNIAKNVSKIFAEAFGFGKVAEGTDVFTEALRDLNNVVNKEGTGGLKDFVHNTLKPFLDESLFPFLKNDLLPLLKNLGKLIGNLVNSRVFGGDPTANRVESQQSVLKNLLGKDYDESLKKNSAASSVDVGMIDQNERINAQVRMVMQSSASTAEKKAALEKIAELEAAISDDDYEAGTSASGTMSKILKSIAYGTTASAIKPEDIDSALKQSKARAGNLMGTGGFLRDGLAYVHQGEMIVPEMFARNGAPYSQPGNTQSPPETKVAVSINVDDRKLRDLFNVTVEKVIEGA